MYHHDVQGIAVIRFNRRNKPPVVGVRKPVRSDFVIVKVSILGFDNEFVDGLELTGVSRLKLRLRLGPLRCSKVPQARRAQAHSGGRSLMRSSLRPLRAVGAEMAAVPGRRQASQSGITLAPEHVAEETRFE